MPINDADAAEFSRRYRHWLDHEGGREKIEIHMARTRSDVASVTRRLGRPPRGVPERF